MDPIFSDDIDASMSDVGHLFQKKTLVAECDVSLLERSGPHPDKIKLLSFLTQRDCTAIPLEEREAYVEYYLSLRRDGHTIPHPTTMFVLQDQTFTNEQTRYLERLLATKSGRRPRVHHRGEITTGWETRIHAFSAEYFADGGESRDELIVRVFPGFGGGGAGEKRIRDHERGRTVGCSSTPG